MNDIFYTKGPSMVGHLNCCGVAARMLSQMWGSDEKKCAINDCGDKYEAYFCNEKHEIVIVSHPRSMKIVKIVLLDSKVISLLQFKGRVQLSKIFSKVYFSRLSFRAYRRRQRL